MIAKTFEIRDNGTFIPVMAVKLMPACEADRYLLARAGFGRNAETQSSYVMVWRMAGGTGIATSDVYEWGGASRTMAVAHQHIENHFDILESGTVVDVEFILQEKLTPKVSESQEEGAI